MNVSDLKFVERRRRLARSWNLVGTALLLILVGLGATLYFRMPFLANPLRVMDLLKEGTLERSTMELMAAMLPIVVLLCLSVTAIIVVFGFAIFSNERRYIAIIDELEQRAKNDLAAQ
jgi:membrane-anchored protein YejM (alkaline phosphatase superfamily)